MKIRFEKTESCKTVTNVLNLDEFLGMFDNLKVNATTLCQSIPHVCNGRHDSTTAARDAEVIQIMEAKFEELRPVYEELCSILHKVETLLLDYTCDFCGDEGEDLYETVHANVDEEDDPYWTLYDEMNAQDYGDCDCCTYFSELVLDVVAACCINDDRRPEEKIEFRFPEDLFGEGADTGAYRKEKLQRLLDACDQLRSKFAEYAKRMEALLAAAA